MWMIQMLSAPDSGTSTLSPASAASVWRTSARLPTVADVNRMITVFGPAKLKSQVRCD